MMKKAFFILSFLKGDFSFQKKKYYFCIVLANFIISFWRLLIGLTNKIILPLKLKKNVPPFPNKAKNMIQRVFFENTSTGCY